MRDTFGPTPIVDRLLAFFDIGGRPDRVKRPVEAQARIDVAWEFIGLRDDRFEGRPNECVAVRLASGQRSRVAAKERQVRIEVLTDDPEKLSQRITNVRHV